MLNNTFQVLIGDNNVALFKRVFGKNSTTKSDFKQMRDMAIKEDPSVVNVLPIGAGSMRIELNKFRRNNKGKDIIFLYINCTGGYGSYNPVHAFVCIISVDPQTNKQKGEVLKIFNSIMFIMN